MATERGEYRPMFCRILNGPDFRRLTPIARACLWPLKLRLPSAGIGVIPALVATLAEDTGFTEAEVREALDELQRSPFEGPSEGGERRPAWLRVEGTVVWLIRGLEFEPTVNPNDDKHRLHVRRTVASLPTVPLVQEYKSRYATWFQDEPKGPPKMPTSSSQGPANGLTRPSEGSTKGLRSKTLTPTTNSKQIRAPSPVFEEAWAAYPKRAANSKSQALRNWQARVADGEPESGMLAGTKAYAEYIAREGTDPKYVKLGATFYGPDRHFLTDYTDLGPPRKSGGHDLQDEPDLDWETDEPGVPRGR